MTTTTEQTNPLEKAAVWDYYMAQKAKGESILPTATKSKPTTWDTARSMFWVSALIFAVGLPVIALKWLWTWF